MTASTKTFERAVLRPLHVLLIAAALVFLFRAMWLWLAGSVVAFFYLGSIGATLHPRRSASELASGPVEGRSAKEEERDSTPEEVRMLVGNAATRVGILIGFIAAFLLCGLLGWRWYFGIPAGLFCTVVSGGILKFLYRTT